MILVICCVFFTGFESIGLVLNLCLDALFEEKLL